MVGQTVGQDAQTVTLAADDQLVILAHVGEEVVFDGAETRYDPTAADIRVQVPFGVDRIVCRLGVCTRAGPLLKQLCRQAYPVFGGLEVVDAHIVQHLTEHRLRAVREVLCQQTSPLCLILVVHSIELPLSLPRVHVAAVVAPAGSFGIQSLVDGVIQTVPHLDDTLLAQQSVRCQYLLGALLVAACEALVLQQVLENARGVFMAVVLAQYVLVLVHKDNFRVPAEQPETLARHAVVIMSADCIPVMVIPVGVAAILVDEHIVDELVEVEQGVQLLVALIVPGIGRCLCHQLPSLQVAFCSLQVVAAVLLHLDNINLAFLAADVVLAELVVHALRNVVESPVHTVQEEVHIAGVDTCVAHLALHTPRPYIARVLCLLTVSLVPVLPGVAEVAAQHQLVELRRRVLTEDGRLQRLRSVFLLEHQSERVLRVLLGQSAVTAVQSDAAGRREVNKCAAVHSFATR